jgi:GntR family transcriptional regulator
MNMSDALAGGTPTFNPLYKEVKMRLTRSLIAGEWKAGGVIPSETRLSQRFNVSIGTIRKAIDELVSENILVRQQGRGTFVATHTEDRQLYYFFHIVGKDGSKEPPVHEMHSFRTLKADDDAASRLALKPGERVFRIQNILKLAQNPVIFDELVLPVARFPDLTGASFGGRDGTIYGLYQARYGINVVRISESLSAGQADANIAEVLGIRTITPVLVIKRVAYTYHDQPVELRTSWVNTADHEYFTALSKNDAR